MSVKKDFSLYFIGNVLSKAVAFILVPIYISSMSQAQYGVVGSMQVLINFCVILMSLGTERSIYRLYHDYKDFHERKEFLGTVNWYIIIAGMITTIVLLLSHSIIGQLFKSIAFYPYYVLAIGISFLTIFEVAPKIYFQVSGNSKKYLTISIVQMITTAAFVLYFTVYCHKEAFGMLSGMLISLIVTLPYFLWIHFKEFSPKFRFKYLQPTLKYCLPLLPSVISAWLINMSSQIFIERNFSTSEVAIYALSLKVVALVTIISSSLMTAYNPTFYKLANSENQYEAKSKLYHLQNKIILMLIVCTGALGVFARDIIDLFLPPEYRVAIYIIPILVCGTLIAQLTGFLNLAFYQNKKTMQIMWINIISAFITILLNSFLVPKYSVYGAAATYLCSTLSFFFLEYFISKKHYFIPYKWSRIIIAVTVLFIFYMVNTTILPCSLFYSSFKLVVFGIICFAVFFNYKRI